MPPVHEAKCCRVQSGLSPDGGVCSTENLRSSRDDVVRFEVSSKEASNVECWRN